MAAQLLATKRFCSRGDQACNSLATTSFPVPVSPVINTGMEVGATRATCSMTARVAALSATMWGGASHAACVVVSSESVAMSVDGASVAERDTAAYAPRWTASIACGGAIGDVDAQIHRSAPRGGAGGLARFVARTRGRE